MVSQGKFQSWELPILEKQRLLREANSAYSLTELELDAVNSRFGEPMSGDLLESILSHLYSEVELDEIDDNDGADPEDNSENPSLRLCHYLRKVQSLVVRK